MESDQGPNVERVVFYDDQCRLCGGTVAMLRRADRSGRLRFVPLSREAAACRAGSALDGIIFESGERRLLRSDAMIEIARVLGLPWSLFTLARVVPRAWRDAAYDWVARHRHRIFGRGSRG